MVDTTTGELVKRRLEHSTGEAERFYAALPAPARVGIAATVATQWLEKAQSDHYPFAARILPLTLLLK